MRIRHFSWFIIVLYVICGVTCGYAQLPRSLEFHEKYTLQEVVVLSRHNIRSPLSGPESVLGRITPHQWFDWSSAPSELSLRGGVLETMMGQFFRKWLVQEGLIEENELPEECSVRFYANSMQRTIATALYFSSGMMPVANVKIEHHYPVGTMDPIFTPKLTFISDNYSTEAVQQIADLFGNGSLAGIGQKMASNFALLQQVIDIQDSPMCQEDGQCSFNTDDTQIILELDKEPAMRGGLKLACSAADALVLQYYENENDRQAAFGHDLAIEDWEDISEVKDWYGDVLFTAPLIAINVAHPLLQEILNELQADGRRFTFLCGHDSNLSSVLAAIGVTNYRLPHAIESKTPIGCKIVIEKWLGSDGRQYTAMNLVYQSVDQLRHMPLLSLQNPPMVYSVSIDALTANADGLYLLSDFEALLTNRINQYDQLISGIPMLSSPAQKVGLHRTYTPAGQPADVHPHGIVIGKGKKALLK